MSMLSSMTDKLRETAHEVKRIKDNNADWLWRDGITLNDAVRELCDAADTIDELRCRCQDAQAENVKLRERVSDLEELTDGKHYIPQEWYAMLQTENARLRADITELYRCSRQCGCDKCAYRDQCALLARLRDMGVDE